LNKQETASDRGFFISSGKGFSVLLTKDFISPRAVCKVLGVFAFGMLSACKGSTAKTVGDNLAGAYSMVTLPSKQSVFVLNSSFSPEYEDGSLLRFEINKEGVLTKKEATVLPRLGTIMAVTADEKYIAVGFSGKKSFVRFFNVENPASPVEVAEVIFEDASTQGITFQDLTFFTRPGNPGEYFLAGSIEFTARLAPKVFVLKFNGSTAVRHFTLPDDLPNNPTAYRLGYTSPLYLKETDQFVAFPRSPSGKIPTLRPEIPTKLLKEKKLESGDIRTVSLIAFPFEKFASAADIKFVPLVWNNDLKVESAAAEDSTEFRSAFYRTSLNLAKAVNSQGCYDRNTLPQVPNALAKDAVLAVDGSELRSEVLKFSGWEALNTAASVPVALPAYSLETPNGELVAHVVWDNPLTREFYSRTQDVEELSGNRTEIQKIDILEAEGACVPVWNRYEKREKNSGSEVSRVQTGHGREAGNPLTLVNPIKGAVASTVFGDLMVTVSYSAGEFSVLRYGSGKWDVVSTFK
jgi:hypothetical protein